MASLSASCQLSTVNCQLFKDWLKTNYTDDKSISIQLSRSLQAQSGDTSTVVSRDYLAAQAQRCQRKYIQ